MKYNLVPSGKANDSDIKYIYVLPSAFESSSYSIAYPDCTTEDILRNRIAVRTFDGCSSDALKEIEVELKDRFRGKQKKYEERLNSFFAGGIGVLILGIINWIIPDPLPLVDELLFTIGGGLTAWKAWNDRRTKLPALVEQTYRYTYEGVRPEVESDNVLTAIFKSIRCKVDPLAAGEAISDLDRIEIEALWMTRYLNIQDLTASMKPGLSGLEDLIEVIEKIFPIRKLIQLERKKQRSKVRSRHQNLKQKTIRNTGITADSLAVYVEFYRVFRNYSAD